MPSDKEMTIPTQGKSVAIKSELLRKNNRVTGRPRQGLGLVHAVSRWSLLMRAGNAHQRAAFTCENIWTGSGRVLCRISSHFKKEDLGPCTNDTQKQWRENTSPSAGELLLHKLEGSVTDLDTGSGPSALPSCHQPLSTFTTTPPGRLQAAKLGALTSSDSNKG